MDKSLFTQICKDSYEECKDFWEVDSEPTMPDSFEIAGIKSELSSIESVTFIAAIEERLSNAGIEVSFIDHFMDIENSSINIESMYEVLKQCGA